MLRLALAHFIGQPLTPDVVERIAFIALGGKDFCRDPAHFVPMEYHGYIIQVERLRDIVSELHALHVAHYLETEKHRAGIPLNPDYTAMILRERAGLGVQFTIRKEGFLVGNLRMWLGVSEHTQTGFAREDTLFIAPEHRGSFLVMALLRYAERVLFGQIGVLEIRIDSKVVNKANVLMKRLGYPLVAMLHVKTRGAWAASNEGD